MVVIRGVTGGTNMPGARSTRGTSGGFRVGGGTDDTREANASSGVAGASAIGLLAVQELGPAGERDARLSAWRGNASGIEGFAIGIAGRPGRSGAA